jgi:hypothetical protein
VTRVRFELGLAFGSDEFGAETSSDGTAMYERLQDTPANDPVSMRPVKVAKMSLAGRAAILELWDDSVRCRFQHMMRVFVFLSASICLRFISD